MFLRGRFQFLGARYNFRTYGQVTSVICGLVIILGMVSSSDELMREVFPKLVTEYENRSEMEKRRNIKLTTESTSLTLRLWEVEEETVNTRWKVNESKCYRHYRKENNVFFANTIIGHIPSVASAEQDINRAIRKSERYFPVNVQGGHDDVINCIETLRLQPNARRLKWSRWWR
jgi:thymidylate synthase